MWEQITVAYSQTREACLEHRQKKRKEWITADTWQANESRRAQMKKVIDTDQKDGKSSTEQQTGQ